jgi:hypothetical protein
MDLNCSFMGEIFSQLAKDERILYCSSEERSIKLMGSISRILIYRPSVVSTMPFRISLTGRKG